MNPRIGQYLLMGLVMGVILTVMHFATRPKAPPSSSPAGQTTPGVPTDRSPLAFEPPPLPDFADEFDSEDFDPDDPKFDMPEFDLPEYEPLPDEQLRIFQDAWGAIQSQDSEWLIAILTGSPEAAQWASEGQTLLLLAIQEQNEPALRALLAASADVNYSNGMGASPLIDAIAFTWPYAVPILLDAGAGIESPTGVIGQTPLMIAAENADISSMQRLLNAGADIDARNDLNQGETALFCAVNASQPKSIRFLLDAGIDAAITNTITRLNAEQTALDMYNSEFFVDKEPILAMIDAFEAEPAPAAD